jgi:hypothetical protein
VASSADALGHRLARVEQRGNLRAAAIQLREVFLAVLVIHPEQFGVEQQQPAKEAVLRADRIGRHVLGLIGSMSAFDWPPDLKPVTTLA